MLTNLKRTVEIQKRIGQHYGKFYQLKAKTGTEKLVVEDIELYDKLDIVNSFNEYFTIVASTLLENRPSPGIQQPVPQSQTPSQIFSLPIIDEKDIEYYESHKDHLYRQHSSESSEDCSTAYQYSASQEIQSIIQH